MRRGVLRFLLAVVMVAPVMGATKMRLHNSASSIAGYKCMDLSLGPAGHAVISTITTATASGTDIQMTATAGGTALAWISEPLSAGVTISGTVTGNLYGGESGTGVNAGFRVRIYKYTGGVEGSSILTADMGSELSTSLTTVRNWTGTPSSTAFATGDRIVVKFFLTNVGGTMGSGTCTGHYDGPTDATDGSSWLQINESATFNPDGGTGGPTPTVIQTRITGDINNGGQTLAANATINVFHWNPTLANNCQELWVRIGTATTALTVTDDQSNTWQDGPVQRDASTSGDTWACFLAPNSAAGTRKIKVQTSAASIYYGCILREIAFVAKSSVLDASSITYSGNGTGSITAGSATPTVSGDFVSYAFSTPMSDVKPTNYVAGTAGAGNITWTLQRGNFVSRMASMDGVYSSTSALNPAMTVQPSTVAFAGAGAIFLKAANNGTAQTASMYAKGTIDWTTELGDSTNVIQFFPTTGNLIVLCVGAGGNGDVNASGVSDAVGNGWAACGGRSDGGQNSTRIYYGSNVVANATNIVKFSLNNTTSDANCSLIEIVGAASSPFAGGTDYKTNSAHKTGTSNLTALTITPSTSSGIVIANAAWDFDTATNTAGSFVLQCGYMNVNTAGNSPYYENNGFASYNVTSTAATDLTWVFLGDSPGGTDVGDWTSSAAFFKAPSTSTSRGFFLFYR